jgi:hypothetical protein
LAPRQNYFLVQHLEKLPDDLENCNFSAICLSSLLFFTLCAYLLVKLINNYVCYAEITFILNFRRLTN